MPLKATDYGDEAALQKLIADHPEVLAGERMTPDEPRRWLLISREVPIGGSPDSGSSWSVDHLILDQDGRPTLVEVKLAKNPEIRRRVVGQMLDYVAHAVGHWTSDTIRRRLEARVGSEEAAREEIARLRGNGAEPSPQSYRAFWTLVDTNLTEQNMRLLFVADSIPQGLATVVGFLNRHMAPRVEVLAVELRQFVGGGLRTLVPRIVGTSDRQVTHGSGATRVHTSETLLAAFEETSVREAARELLTRSSEAGAAFEFGPSGVSIRARCAAWRSQLVTVAWLFPPNALGWMRTRDFSFGAGILESDPPPAPPLVEVLTGYVAAFETDAWAHADASSKGVSAYRVAPNDAAEHIETLCERVEAVLRELAALPPADE